MEKPEGRSLKKWTIIVLLYWSKLELVCSEGKTEMKREATARIKAERVEKL